MILIDDPGGYCLQYNEEQKSVSIGDIEEYVNIPIEIFENMIDAFNHHHNFDNGRKRLRTRPT